MRRSKRVPTLLKEATVSKETPSSSKSSQGSVHRELASGESKSQFSDGSGSLSSGLKTPNFFDSDPTPRRCLLSAFENELVERLNDASKASSGPSVVETEATSDSRRSATSAMKNVRAFVEVGAPFDGQSLKNSLRKLNATVCTRFGKHVTHLIFWNGLQEVLDNAHQKGFYPVIVAPHWVDKCVEAEEHVDEKPYLLYGLTGLALPHAEMAKGRVGKITDSGSSRKRSAVIGALERSSTKRHCLENRQQNASVKGEEGETSGSLPSGSDLVYSIETLGDQLAPLLSSLETSGISVAEVISPIFERVKQRVQEISNSSIVLTPTTADAFARAGHHVCIKDSSLGSPEDESVRILRESQNSEQDKQIASASTSSGNLVRQRTVNGVESINSSAPPMLDGESTRDGVRGRENRHTPERDLSNVPERLLSVNVTRSEPSKKRGRPWIPADQMTPLQFEKAMLRRCPKSYRSHLRLNAEERVAAYRDYLDKNTQEQPEVVDSNPTQGQRQKPRPITVRTRSTLLNDLQNVNSSEEFVRSQSRLRQVRRKPGNIVLSGITESDRENIYAIVRRLGILRVLKNLDEHTRFVIGDDAGLRTMNVMQALASGIPVVSPEWVYRSLENMSWQNAQEFIIPKWKAAFKAYRKGRMSELFSSLGCFFISNRCAPPADQLTRLVQKCGGKVTESFSRASIFIAPRGQWHGLLARHRNDQEIVRAVPERWVLDSITRVEVCSFEHYQEDETESEDHGSQNEGSCEKEKEGERNAADTDKSENADERMDVGEEIREVRCVADLSEQAGEVQ